MSPTWTLRLAGRSLTIEIEDGAPIAEFPELLIFPPDARREELIELLCSEAS